MAKDYYIARDAYKLEDLAAKKYQFYAQNATNPEVQQLFSQISQVQQKQLKSFNK
ncbi:rubrerythrin [Caldalkalibacillus uzonensis]|uniref:Rubrerythrin n=1 Tax=Caldalkalibacillus uzonensis TaxID=353224 RepID=A0ABU0CXF1_9BACI|nr:hypothetical protein [Caldalkalibacillus uzonensis]MDQ0340804.1 rubrerythrin [Caldalkalibacillus uzonensis]